MNRLLDFLVKGVPQASISPYFAARVCSRLPERGPDFLSAVLRLARPVIPMLTTFSLVALAVTYLLVPRAEMSLSIPETLVEPDQSTEQMTVDQVLTSLSFEENGLEH